MPTRHLSEAQRRQYGRFPASLAPDQLARYFHLDTADREIIAQLRGAHNRLGFAIQLGSVRFLGTFPETFADIPHSVIQDVARQLDEAPSMAAGFYQGGRQRWRHMALIVERYGYRRFDAEGFARFRLARWLYSLCWTGDDRPALLFERAVGWLIANKVLLPGVSTLERFVGQIRDRA